MKTILYIVSTLGHSGPTNQLYNIIKYLDRKKFEPYVITLSPEPQRSRWNDYADLKVNLYSLGLSRLQGFIHAKRQVQTLIAEIKPDIVHTQGIRGDIISSKSKVDVPKLATIRNIPQLDYILTYGRVIGCFMYRWHIRALKKIPLCIGVSEAVSNNLKNKYEIRNVLTIQNGIDTGIYFPSNDNEKSQLRRINKLPLNGNIFISSGHLSERKDPLFLVRMWSKKFASHDNNHLVFIGKGKLQEKCVKESANIKNVHILGQVDNTVDYLRSGDYFISVSQAEGLPNAVLEAMACGLPVLLSGIQPHKEILAFSPGAGFYYEPGNEESFSSYLDKMITMDKAAMRKASLESIKQNFDAQKMSEAYQKQYNRLLLTFCEAA